MSECVREDADGMNECNAIELQAWSRLAQDLIDILVDPASSRLQIGMRVKTEDGFPSLTFRTV